MIVKHEIEYETTPGEFECLVVAFEGEPTVMNDSFDYAGTHCTHGKSGTYKSKDYLIVEDIIWDESNYTQKENMIIKVYIGNKKNYDRVMGELCEAYQKEYSAEY